MPFFSIVIPNYNGEKYLAACLDSILSQNFRDFEVIVVDNYSEDKSEQILKLYKQKDSRISYYLEHNQGVIAHSRNFGINKASGKWICTIDSDDIWYTEKLQRVYDVIHNNPQIDVINHYMLMANMLGGSKAPMVTPRFKNNVYRQLLLHRNMFVQSSMCYRSSFLRDNHLEFNESHEFVTVEDYDFSMQVARAGARFYCIKEYLGEWRVYKANNSSSPKHIKNFRELVYKHVYEIQQFETNKDKLWKRIEAGAHINEANICLNNKKWRDACRFYIKAILKSPLQVSGYFFDRMRLSFIRFMFKCDLR